MTGRRRPNELPFAAWPFSASVHLLPGAFCEREEGQWVSGGLLELKIRFQAANSLHPYVKSPETYENRGVTERGLVNTQTQSNASAGQKGDAEGGGGLTWSCKPWRGTLQLDRCGARAATPEGIPCHLPLGCL